MDLNIYLHQIFFYDQREMMVDDSLKRIMRVAWGGRKEEEELRYII